jgi:hypothetical protein
MIQGRGSDKRTSLKRLLHLPRPALTDSRDTFGCSSSASSVGPADSSLSLSSTLSYPTFDGFVRKDCTATDPFVTIWCLIDGKWSIPRVEDQSFPTIELTSTSKPRSTAEPAGDSQLKRLKKR